MTRLMYGLAAVVLALGITCVNVSSEPLLGIPFAFAAAFLFDVGQRRRRTAARLRAAQAEDAADCRAITVDGDTVLVHGTGDLREEYQAALAELIRAGKRRLREAEAQGTAPATQAPADGGELVVYRWRCPYCTDGDMGPSQGRCLHCAGTGLTNDVAGWDPAELVPAPHPPGVMRKPCVDCAYRLGSPELEANGEQLPERAPFWCHHGMTHGYGDSYQSPGGYRPAGSTHEIPLGEQLCAGWWALQTGRPLPTEPFREPGSRGVQP